MANITTLNAFSLTPHSIVPGGFDVTVVDHAVDDARRKALSVTYLKVTGWDWYYLWTVLDDLLTLHHRLEALRPNANHRQSHTV